MASVDGSISQSDSDDGVLEEVALADVKALQKAVGQQVIRERIRDIPALVRALNDIQVVASMPFLDSLLVSHPAPVQADGVQAKRALADDDIKREDEFARLALAAVEDGLKQLRAASVPFRRPDDYMAEMVKSDKHMAKVKDKLVHQKEKVDAAETRRKQRMSKKESRKLQVQKEQERRSSAKQQTKAVETLRRERLKARARGEDPDDGKDFPVDLLELEELQDGKFVSNGPRPNKKPSTANRKREEKDKKYGFGGKKKGAKRNDSKSASDMGDFSARRNKQLPPGLSRKGSTGVNKRAVKKRPGKARRQQKR